jgi:hypothetical protein
MLTKEEMSTLKRRCGRLGGLKTYNRYGCEFYSKAGKLGGRPRLPTLSELLVQQEQNQRKNFIKEDGYPGNNLRKLKMLYAIKMSEAATVSQTAAASDKGDSKTPMTILTEVLRKEHIAAGLMLEESEDELQLKQGEKVLASWSSHGATIESVLHEADQVVEAKKSGVEFAKV